MEQGMKAPTTILRDDGVKLKCMWSYAVATEEDRAAICNGCGPKGAAIDLVPDTMYLLDMTEVCDIHDWDYSFCSSKKVSDLRMWNNARRVIMAAEWWLVPNRLARASIYYAGVAIGGGEAYKNAQKEALKL